MDETAWPTYFLPNDIIDETRATAGSERLFLRVKMSVMLLSEKPAMLRGDTAEVSPRLVDERATHDLSAPLTVARGPGVTKDPPMVAMRASTANFIVRGLDIWDVFLPCETSTEIMREDGSRREGGWGVRIKLAKAVCVSGGDKKKGG